jgi:hypothetical protein
LEFLCGCWWGVRSGVVVGVAAVVKDRVVGRSSARAEDEDEDVDGVGAEVGAGVATEAEAEAEVEADRTTS